MGWDDNYSKSNFTIVPPGDGAFLIKNSWGTGWGNQGYFWISYYDTAYAIATYQGDGISVAFSDNQPTTDFDRQYEYDELGWVTSLGYASTTAWFANVFTAQSTEQLKAVATYVASNNSPYVIRIYTGVTSGTTTGTLAATTSGTFALAGYNTLVLPQSVSLTAGQTFSVVVELTTPGYTYPIPVEYAQPGSTSQATASPGQSYFSQDGTNWSDATTWKSTANVALKAFSSNPSSTTTTLSSGLTPSVYGQTVTFTATVTSGSGTPTGSVKFYQSGTCASHGTQIGSTQTLDVSGQASVSTSSLAASGTAYSILACYLGNGSYSASSGTASQTVNKATSSALLSTTLGDDAGGATYSFAVTVSPQYAGTPTGTVTFTDSASGTFPDNTPASFDNTTGQWTLGPIAASNFAAGSHTITASYRGDSDFQLSSDVSLIMVATATSANTVSAGQTTTMDVHISSDDPNVQSHTLMLGCNVFSLSNNNNSYATCSISPNPVTFDSSGNPTTTVSVTICTNTTAACTTTKALAVPPMAGSDPTLRLAKGPAGAGSTPPCW